MARQVLPIVGALVGGFFGAPQLGFMLGSIIGNAVDPQVIKGPSIGDGQTQTSKEGVPCPIVYGTASMAGTRQGKGGGPVTEEERIHLTYAIRICEGPMQAMLRVWEDEKLVYDIRPGGQVSPEENNKFAESFRLYLGGEDQNPDPELEVTYGVGDTPSYRGICYIVFPRKDVTDRRGSIPNYRFEMAAFAQVVSIPGLVTKSRVFTGSPTNLEVSQLIGSLEVDGGRPSISSSGAMDISPDRKYVAFHYASADPGVRLLQLNEETQQYEPFSRLSSGRYGNVGVSFTPGGRYLITAGRRRRHDP